MQVTFRTMLAPQLLWNRFEMTTGDSNVHSERATWSIERSERR
jgi:hypothetical protein